MISKEEKADWEVLCEECSSAAKEAGLTKEDSKRMLEEYRTMERKALEYDELLEKLEEKQKEIDDLNQFYETYEINYEGQAVLIDRNKFKEVIGADKEFSILVVNALPSIEEN